MRLENEIVIIASHALLKEIEAMTIFVTTNGRQIHKNVLSFDVSHAFCNPLHLPYLHPEKYESILNSYMENIDYICTSCRKIFEVMKKNIKNLDKKPIILKAGSLSLDSYINDVKHFENKKEKSRKVIIALNDISQTKEIIKLCSLILENKFEILFRPNPRSRLENVMKIVNSFKENCFFKFDTESTLSIENRVNSFCLITDYSSLGYTYPLSAKNTTIIFSLQKEERYIKGYSFFDKKIHYKANKIEDIVSYLKKIDKKNIDLTFTIEDYLKNEVFNVLKSEDFIVKKLVEILESKNS